MNAVAALVEEARDGDNSAFGELYELTHKRAFGAALAVTKEPHRAEDVTHEAFERAWHRLDSLEEPAAFGGWVGSIAVNLARNTAVRDARVDLGAEAEFLDLVSSEAGYSEDDPERAAEVREIRTLINGAACGLDGRDRSVVSMIVDRDMRNSEIADELGIPAKHANVVVARCRKRLGSAVSAFVLWRGGEPSCDRLRRQLADAAAFDASVVRRIRQHSKLCGTCRGHLGNRLAPSDLYGVVPVALAGGFGGRDALDRFVQDSVARPRFSSAFFVKISELPVEVSSLVSSVSERVGAKLVPAAAATVIAATAAAPMLSGATHETSPLSVPASAAVPETAGPEEVVDLPAMLPVVFGSEPAGAGVREIGTETPVSHEVEAEMVQETREVAPGPPVATGGSRPFESWGREDPCSAARATSAVAWRARCGASATKPGPAEQEPSHADFELNIGATVPEPGAAGSDDTAQPAVGEAGEDEPADDAGAPGGIPGGITVSEKQAEFAPAAER